MADDEKPDRRRMRVVLSGADPVPTPVGANYFHFTVVGPEVQLLVGNVNLLRMHEASTSTESEIVPQITHRFQLSPLGFYQLKSQIDEIQGSVPRLDGVDVSVRID